MDTTSYLLGKNAGGGTSANLQDNKNVSVTTNGTQEITPDTGYDGLKKATVSTSVTPNLQNKSITITTNTTTTVTADEGYDGLGTVEIITNVSSGGLPDTFQAVSYIQSSGTQYIDTGVKANSEIEITITVNHLFDTTEGSKCLYGGGIGWENKYIQGELDQFPYFAFNNQSRGQRYTPSIGLDYIVNQNKNVIKINNATFYTFTYNSFTTNDNITLFAGNRSGDIVEFGTYRVKSCQIRDNNILVRNFVPCYRKSDNEVGLYDTINEVFYTNDGSGDFSYNV